MGSSYFNCYLSKEMKRLFWVVRRTITKQNTNSMHRLLLTNTQCLVFRKKMSIIFHVINAFYSEKATRDCSNRFSMTHSDSLSYFRAMACFNIISRSLKSIQYNALSITIVATIICRKSQWTSTHSYCHFNHSIPALLKRYNCHTSSTPHRSNRVWLKHNKKKTKQNQTQQNPVREREREEKGWNGGKW